MQKSSFSDNQVINVLKKIIPLNFSLLAINQKQKKILLRNNDTYLLVYEYDFKSSSLDSVFLKDVTYDDIEQIKNIFNETYIVKPFDASIFEKPL